MSHLSLHFLGSPIVMRDNVPVEMGRRKLTALLAYLAITGRGHHRDALAEIFWPEAEDPRSRGNLRRNLSELKSILSAEELEIDRDNVRLVQDGSIWVDVLRFRDLIQHVRFHNNPADDISMTCLSSLSEASGLYRGDFLTGVDLDGCREFEQWQSEEREDLQDDLAWALPILIQGYRSQGEIDTAIGHAKHWWNLDRYQEEPCRQLMSLYAQAGRQPAALRVHEGLLQELQEIDATPEAETEALYREIAVNTQRRSVPPLELQPFVAGPPIVHPRQFFGRERVVSRLFGLWRSIPLQNAAVVGPRRSGKTSLLHYLRSINRTPVDHLRPGQRTNWLPQPLWYRWIFVDLQNPNMRSRAGLTKHLLKEMGITVDGTCDLEQFMGIVSETLHAPAIILIDEFGSLLESHSDLDNTFWEGLRALASNQVDGNLAFVLSAGEPPHKLIQGSHLSSPFFNIFGYTAHLGPLTEEEARELIACSPVAFTPEDMEWILEQSGRWPFLLQILCRECLASHNSREANADWHEEGLSQIEPWRYLLEASPG